MAPEGVGEATASMLYATLGNRTLLTNRRQASAFVGLTPKQYSSIGKVTMLGIDKFGGVKDLHSLLYLGVMAYIYRLPESPKNQKQTWLIKLSIGLLSKEPVSPWQTRQSGQLGQCSTVKRNISQIHYLVSLMN
ncbi:transposase [Vibrio aestuarianus]|nr:transposase [Vibrio aestuarianus]MDE1213514.1 transposase [Vibrio aestuarianus]MDE1227984.1 transposase [Vibrio aestuarianus]MDE1272094.1 transposase [Vibrio aestuarianus]MDE1293478.1 transposase [Vibrio aestuarianus]MDE1307661.1 transposase [Vibrio aestuarianus]